MRVVDFAQLVRLADVAIDVLVVVAIVPLEDDFLPLGRHDGVGAVVGVACVNSGLNGISGDSEPQGVNCVVGYKGHLLAGMRDH